MLTRRLCNKLEKEERRDKEYGFSVALSRRNLCTRTQWIRHKAEGRYQLQTCFILKKVGTLGFAPRSHVIG
jgi:hypothetical protein